MSRLQVSKRMWITVRPGPETGEPPDRHLDTGMAEGSDALLDSQG